MFVFGDGLSDSGNINTERSLNGEPYWLEGTFSNAYSTSHFLQQLYPGAKFYNFAQGYARLLTSNLKSPPIASQIDSFQRQEIVGRPCDIMFLWGGLNDMLALDMTREDGLRFLNPFSELYTSTSGETYSTLMGDLNDICQKLLTAAERTGIPLQNVAMLGLVDMNSTAMYSSKYPLPAYQTFRNALFAKITGIENVMHKRCSAFIPIANAMKSAWQAASASNAHHALSVTAVDDILHQLRIYSPKTAWICNTEMGMPIACNIPQNVRREWDYNVYAYIDMTHPSKWFMRDILSRVASQFPFFTPLSFSPPPPYVERANAPAPPPQLLPRQALDAFLSWPIVAGGSAALLLMLGMALYCCRLRWPKRATDTAKSDAPQPVLSEAVSTIVRAQHVSELTSMPTIIAECKSFHLSDTHVATTSTPKSFHKTEDAPKPSNKSVTVHASEL